MIKYDYIIYINIKNEMCLIKKKNALLKNNGIYSVVCRTKYSIVYVAIAYTT